MPVLTRSEASLIMLWVTLKNSGADPSPSRPEHGNGDDMACSAQGGTFKRRVTRERGTAQLSENVSTDSGQASAGSGPAQGIWHFAGNYWHPVTIVARIFILRTTGADCRNDFSFISMCLRGTQ